MPNGLSLASAPKGTLSAWEPSLRDKLAWAFSDMFGTDRTSVNYVNSKVRGASDFVPGVGDALAFDDAKTNFDQGNYGQAALDAGTGILGSVPGVGDAAAAGLKAGGSALGMLMGPTSRLWNKEMADKAVDMLQDGQVPGRVWTETGTEWSPKRGNLTQEIPDFRARIHPDVTAWGSGAFNLDDVGFSSDAFDPSIMENVLTHPEFFDAYPDARGIGVVEQGSLGYKGPGGVFVAGGPDYVHGGDVPDDYIGVATPHSVGSEASGILDPRSVMLHELQHWVQKKEGWDPGFNPNAAAYTASRPDSFVKQTALKAAREMARLPAYDAMDLYDLPKKVAFEAYMRNIGETQARTVQNRRDFLPDTAKRVRPGMLDLGGNVFGGGMDRDWDEQLSVDDIINGIFELEGVPGLSLRGPAKRSKKDGSWDASPREDRR